MLEQKPKGVKCPAIDGIVAEADELAGEVADKQVLDAASISSAQAVEHYEIARYGTLIAWADELGRDDIVRLLTTISMKRKPPIRSCPLSRSEKALTARRQADTPPLLKFPR